MALTLRDLVSTPDLGLRLLAEGPDVDRAVTWVHVSELRDPTPFLSGGELLLTTGLTIDDGMDLDSYVRRLAEAAVVGLGFGTGLSHAEVPADLVAAARRHGLPILEVPMKTPFIAISRAVSAAVAAAEYASVTRTFTAQQALTKAALATSGPGSAGASAGPAGARLGGAARPGGCTDRCPPGQLAGEGGRAGCGDDRAGRASRPGELEFPARRRHRQPAIGRHRSAGQGLPGGRPAGAVVRGRPAPGERRRHAADDQARADVDHGCRVGDVAGRRAAAVPGRAGGTGRIDRRAAVHSAALGTDHGPGGDRRCRRDCRRTG